MASLESEQVRRLLGDATRARLGKLDVLAEIGSTNSYLMQQPGPRPGQVNVAVTDNQTAGRGRHGRTWQSPPGSGLCLSMAYSFAVRPTDLPALTLAIGIGAIDALDSLAGGNVSLKWPNDLVAMDGKLGGILTEAQSRGGNEVTIITGVGLNIDLSSHPDLAIDTGWTRHIVDLQSCASELPDLNAITAKLINGLSDTVVNYEGSGFTPFHKRWSDVDWLFGRDIAVETPSRLITGVAAGVDDDGALLVDTPTHGKQRITSGSVKLAIPAGGLS